MSEEAKRCPLCSTRILSTTKVGIRASSGQKSRVITFAQCGHEQLSSDQIITAVKKAQGSSLAVYQGGPLWQAGYQFLNIYWGSYWNRASLSFTPAQVDKATIDIGTDSSYWGGLQEYGIGMNTAQSFLPSVTVAQDPPATIDDAAIEPQLQSWISAGVIPELGQKGCYNIFFPPGVTVTLQGSASCSVYCDYHNFDGIHFYTVEPYPCDTGCNTCSQSPLDTLTMGLSEEMVEMASDMNPGTGWVIQNEEICDYCDSNFICKQLSTGEYVNSWYGDAESNCWVPGQQPAPPNPTPAPSPSPPSPTGNPCLDQILQGVQEALNGQETQGIEDILGGLECILTSSAEKEETSIRKRLSNIRKRL